MGCLLLGTKIVGISVLYEMGDILASGQYEADLSAESPVLKPKGNVSALETLEKAAAHAEGK